MSNKVLGGGYTCSNCGKYHRTTTVCNCGDRKKLPEKKAEKIPTAEEFLHKEIYYERYDRFLEKDIIKALKKFAKLHVKASLEASNQQVKLNDFAHEFLQEGASDAIDKDSILNAYPLTNII